MISWLTPTSLVGRAIGLLIGFTLHEFAHAWVADRLGDELPRRQGRLTLDPRSHIHPLWAFMALVAGFGWAKPVMVQPWRFYPHERRGLMIVSFAGPVTNLIIAAVLSIPARLILAATSLDAITQNGISDFLFEVLLVVIYFNVGMFFFNLIPLAPLDGWKVMLGLVPPHTASELGQYEQESAFILMFIILFGVLTPAFSLVRVILGPLIDATYSILTGL